MRLRIEMKGFNWFGMPAIPFSIGLKGRLYRLGILFPVRWMRQLLRHLITPRI